MNNTRHSLRNIERFSGIKCSLPSGTSTIPNTFKGLEKHKTPTKAKQINASSSSSSIVRSFVLNIDLETSLFFHKQESQTTPTKISAKAKSPWRLRFEKILKHQELTPLSPANEAVAFTTAEVNSRYLKKELKIFSSVYRRH